MKFAVQTLVSFLLWVNASGTRENGKVCREDAGENGCISGCCYDCDGDGKGRGICIDMDPHGVCSDHGCSTNGGITLLELLEPCAQDNECLSGLCTGRPGKEKKCRFCAKKKEVCTDSSECCQSPSGRYCDEGQCKKCPKGVCPQQKESSPPTGSPRPNPSPTPAPTMAAPQPNPSPTRAPTVTAPGGCNREKTFFDILEQVSDKEDLEDPTTAEGMAFNWLLNEDPKNINPCVYPTVIQRYVFAVLYYGNNGTNWGVRDNGSAWLSAFHECGWSQIYCEPFSARVATMFSLRGDNKFSGTIPSLIGELTGLTSLSISGRPDAHNNLGPIPSTIGKLTRLTELRLSRNNIGGPLPSSIGELTRLRSLSLSGNHINGIPSTIEKLKNLDALYLQDNLLTGIPSTIGKLENLSQLYLSDNRLSGAIPSSIGEMVNLRNLFLENNALSGPIPPIFEDLPQLGVLDLAGNRLNGTIPSNIRLSWRLNLESNKLTGTIPSSLFRLQGVNLNLASNALTGSLPYDWGYYSRGRLDLQNNQLSGTLNWVSAGASYLRLDNNSFTGTIPSSLFNNYAVALSLEMNAFTGTIPSTLSTAANNLISLYVHENQLTGTIPEAGNEYYYVFQVHENMLNGTVPDSICNAMRDHPSFSYVLTADCSGPSPEVICTCCSECY